MERSLTGFGRSIGPTTAKTLFSERTAFMHHGRERADVLDRLRDVIASCGRPGQADRPIVPTGWPALNRALPGGGVGRGSLVELLDSPDGAGAETVAAAVTRVACRSPG